MAALNLVRLGHITGDRDLVDRAEQLTGTFAKRIKAYPSAYTQFLAALDFMIGPSHEIVIVESQNGKSSQSIVEAIHRQFVPNKVLLLRPADRQKDRIAALAPFIKELGYQRDRPAVHICEHQSCQQTVTQADQIEAALG